MMGKDTAPDATAIIAKLIELYADQCGVKVEYSILDDDEGGEADVVYRQP